MLRDAQGYLAKEHSLAKEAIWTPLLKHRSKIVRRARTELPSAIGGFIAY